MSRFVLTPAAEGDLLKKCSTSEAAKRCECHRRCWQDHGLPPERSHPENGGKAQFFGDLGFTREAPAALANALRALAISGNVVRQSDSRHRRKFVVDGAIQAPQGRQAIVRTIWIVDAGQDVPRLVTAYPGGV